MFYITYNRLTNAWQEPPQNIGYAGYTGYQANIVYQGNPQWQGQMPQYPYFMPPSYYPYPPPNSVNILPTVIFPPNMPPPYPPH